MSAPSPRPSPEPLDTSTAGPCMDCGCCRGLFPRAPDSQTRVCYTCAINHGIQLRHLESLRRLCGYHLKDLNSVIDLRETVDGIALAIEAIRRGEGLPGIEDVQGWIVNHRFHDPNASLRASHWNIVVCRLLDDLKALDLQEIRRSFGRLCEWIETYSKLVEVDLLELRVLEIIDQVGVVPEALRCPATQFQSAAEAF